VRKREREEAGKEFTEIGGGLLNACDTEFALITRAARHPLPVGTFKCIPASSSAPRAWELLPAREKGSMNLSRVVIERQSFFFFFHNIAVRTSASFIVPPPKGCTPHRTRKIALAVARRRRVVYPLATMTISSPPVRRNPEARRGPRARTAGRSPLVLSRLRPGRAPT